MAKDFNWVEGTSTVKEIIKAIATDLTSPSNFGWKLIYPGKSDDIKNIAIIETKTSFNKNFYLKFERPDNELNYMLVTLGNKMNASKNDIDAEVRSHPARFAWYQKSEGLQLYDWLPIQYWISFSEDFINMVIQGDPSLDISPYNNYLISYMYAGALESFEGADKDSDYNFGLTVSSDKFYNSSDFPKEYGNRTATCITDIGMVGTRTAVPFQAHLPKFNTSWEFTDKHFITSSNWTHKFHFSEIIIYHAYDRERGKLQNVLIGDRSSIFHLDILIKDKGTDDEKQYQMFNINAPYSILNNGPNVLYGVALRRS